MLCKEFPRDVHGALSLVAGTQENGGQFGIGQGFGAITQEFLPGAVLFRPLFDGHEFVR